MAMHLRRLAARLRGENLLGPRAGAGVGASCCGAAPFRTAPEHTESMPSGIGFIVVNEAAERFSFYGVARRHTPRTAHAVRRPSVHC